MSNPDDLIRRGDAMEIGSAHGWDTDLFRSAIADLPAVAASQPADTARVTVKPDAAETLAKEMQAIVAADRWKGRDLSAAPPEKWSHLRPETRQLWIDTAARILAAIDVHPDPRDAQRRALEKVIRNQRVQIKRLAATAEAHWRFVNRVREERLADPRDEVIKGLEWELEAALAANRGLVRLNEMTEARVERLVDALEEIASYDTGATAGLAYTARAAIAAVKGGDA